jgi:type II secretion system protein H
MPLRTGAFTLVEMLLVVTFMAIFAGALMVSLRGRQDQHALRTTAQDLCEAIRYAASQARTTGTPCRVVFPKAMSEFHVEVLSGDEPAFLPVAGRAGLRKQITPGVEIAEFTPPIPPAAGGSDPDPALMFGADGAGFSGQIALKNRAGQTSHVRVLAETGEAYVQD